jgi:hypothetical protein
MLQGAPKGALFCIQGPEYVTVAQQHQAAADSLGRRVSQQRSSVAKALAQLLA